MQERHLRGSEGCRDGIPVLQCADDAAVVEAVGEAADGRDGIDAELGGLIGQEGELIHPDIVPPSAFAPVISTHGCAARSPARAGPPVLG